MDKGNWFWSTVVDRNAADGRGRRSHRGSRGPVVTDARDGVVRKSVQEMRETARVLHMISDHAKMFSPLELAVVLTHHAKRLDGAANEVEQEGTGGAPAG